MIKNYRDLRVYRQSYELGKDIHQVTHQFPKHEQYELGSQLRRAAISIPLNIAEGYGKKVSAADFKRFILMAMGSCNEVQVLLDYAEDFGYMSLEQHQNQWEAYDQLGRQLNKLHQNWQSI
jgi:four helix bundle protein